MFKLAIDSKLRGCDLVKLLVGDVAPSGQIADRATVRQQKTGRPVDLDVQPWADLSLQLVTSNGAIPLGERSVN